MTDPHVSVRVTRRFEASPERVFDAWFDREKAARWLFATEAGQMVRVDIDPRVGGSFRFVDRRDGEDVEHTGVYLEIDRPRRIVFTLSVPKYGAETSRIVVDIARRGSGCELTLTEERVRSDAAGRSESGWSAVLDSLARAYHVEAAVSFMRLIGSGKVREAYRAHIAPGFRHHNPFFRGDAASLMAGMEENAAKLPDKVLEVKRTLEDGDLVAIHSHVQPKPGDLGVALVHIFRFEGDRIVELWDLGQPVPDDSPNENGMF